MQIFKLSIVLLNIIACYSVVSARVPSAFGIEEDAQKLLQKLEETLSSAVNDAVAELNKDKSEFVKFADDATTQSKNSFSSLVNIYTTNIRASVENAADLGFDVRKCVGTSLTDLSKKGEEMGKNVENFNLEKKKIGTDYIDVVLADSSSILSLADETRKELAICAGSFDPDVCTGKIMASMESYLFEIPTGISKAVEETKKRTNRIMDQIDAFHLAKTEDLKNLMNPIVDGVNNCIVNIINGN